MNAPPLRITTHSERLRKWQLRALELGIVVSIMTWVAFPLINLDYKAAVFALGLLCLIMTITAALSYSYEVEWFIHDHEAVRKRSFLKRVKQTHHPASDIAGVMVVFHDGGNDGPNQWLVKLQTTGGPVLVAGRSVEAEATVIATAIASRLQRPVVAA
jgi:hypothetical protein